MKTHWLYGETHLKVDINEETKYITCIYNKVCSHEMEKQCCNYQLGDSKDTGCGSCTHKFTRYDKDAIPCFYCEDYLSNMDVMA